MKKWWIHQLDINKHLKLLLYILNEIGAHDNYTPLSLSKLAEYSNMSRTSVNSNINKLKNLGMITVKVGKGKAPNKYKLNIKIH